MGNYLNPGKKGFQESLNSAIYVDKTELIAEINSVIDTRRKFVCVSRPRRFGKSMAMDMLAAYYTYGMDSHDLFDGLKIASAPSYEKNLNQYHVLRINMQEFLSATHSVEDMLKRLSRYIRLDIFEVYHSIRFRDEDDLVEVMKDVYSKTGRSFIILIDEWDCLFREYSRDKEAQKKYLDFLRMWLKDQEYVSLAYMTGILPIRKYGTHSALNMFTESSMIDPERLSSCFGFVEQEVKALCAHYEMNSEEARAWYDGYELDGRSIYNPKSIVEAMYRKKLGNYWNRTETYEALKVYIEMNMDGLKDAVVQMLAGEPIGINTETFVNDMTTFATKDDVLTLLIHLGYLSYHEDSKTVSIPNKEVAQEYVNAIQTMDWHEVAHSLNDSKKLLESLWKLDGDAVAAGIDRAHNEISILQYNDENSLSCTIHLAFFYAREYYTIFRELPTGRGFADVVFIPRRKYVDKPAVVIELKYDKSAEGAITQIKERGYTDGLKDYHGKLLLVGINYDKATKKHTCVIETLKR